MVPRRRAQPRLEPLALPLPAGARSRTRTSAPRTAGAASTTRSTNCSTPGRSTRTGTGSSRCTTPRPSPTDLLMSVQVTNAGPDPDTLHVLPTAWFRNTWSWEPGRPRPELAATGDTTRARSRHPFLGELELLAAPGPDGTAPRLLFCENETNTAAPVRRRRGHAVPQGRHQRSRRDRGADRRTRLSAVPSARPGTASTVAPGATVELRLRLRPAGSGRTLRPALGPEFEQRRQARRAEADEFYAELTPAGRVAGRGAW